MLPGSQKSLKNIGFRGVLYTRTNIVGEIESAYKTLKVKNIFSISHTRPFTMKHTYPQHPSKPHIFPGEVAH
jgi:hypothetical protein